MQLSTEQIQKVEQYLNVKGIKYVDIRLEILDHMVSDIEDNISENEVPFHYAFSTAKQKWNPQLQETTSMFFGFGYAAPKIVIQKAKKIYWKHYFLLLLSYFLPFLALTELNFEIQNPSEVSSFIFLKGIAVCSFVSFLYMFMTKKNTLKTTYGFILNAQSLGVLVGLFVLMIFIKNPGELNGIHIGMMCSFLFSTASYFYFYKKHKTEIKKYQIS